LNVNIIDKRRRIMPAVAIITDTDASLPKSISDQYQIRQVPITINFGSEVLKTGIDVDDQSLFARVDKEGKLPTTSAPSPGEFSDAFAQALRSGADSVLCFCVSSEISATYEAAVSARKMMPERDIHVIDTRSLSMGQGFMVLGAAEAAEKGMAAPEILAMIEEMRERIFFFGVLPTLKYVAMSGRVSHVTAGIANVINIKPILTIRDGKLDLLERVRTQRKAWARAIELSVEAAAARKIERLAMVHVTAESDAREFYGQICKAIACPEETLYAELTPGLSVHSGAGMVGAAFLAAD
jgi:DegV family protein with EDD domain